MSMPARRPDPSTPQALSLWSAGEESTDSTAAGAADQPPVTAERTLTPAADADLLAPSVGGSSVESHATVAPQADMVAPATEPGSVAVLAAPPRPVATPPRPGPGGLRLGLGGRATAGFGGDTSNGNGSGARGPLALARAGLRALEVLARLDADRPVGPGDRAALAGWPGWGPMAKAFDPYEQAPGWRQLGERLRELLSPEAGTAAQSASRRSLCSRSPAVRGPAVSAGLRRGFEPGRARWRHHQLDPALHEYGMRPPKTRWSCACWQRSRSLAFNPSPS